MTSRIVIALVVAGSLLGVAFVARSGVTAGPEAPRVEFNVVFDDMDGGRVDFSAFSGKPMVINLWATWCGPCRLEMPQLVGFVDKFRAEGLVIVGISADDTPEAIRTFAAEYKANYPMLVGLGREEFLQRLGYQGLLPFSVLVRRDGTIAEQVTGLKTTADWERRIQALLQ